MSARTVECGTHGTRPAAFVCGHLVEVFPDASQVGFWRSVDDGGVDACGWCDACEQRRVDDGGDWTPEHEKQMNVAMCCLSCLERLQESVIGGRA